MYPYKVRREGGATQATLTHHPLYKVFPLGQGSNALGEHSPTELSAVEMAYVYVVYTGATSHT